jgi:hypothetical protein
MFQVHTARLSKCRSRKVMVAALGFVLLLGAPAALAADDEDELTFEQKLMRQLFGGILSPGADIDYRERSPLVVPPTRDLPPPAQGAAVTNTPAWPVDADVKRRKEEVKRTKQARRVQSDNEEGRALRPDELNVGRKAGAGRVTGPVKPESDRLTPDELGYKGGMWSNFFGTKKEEPVPFAGEPPRTSLIEPPTGYRTPSSAQPYGIIGEEKYTPKAVRPEDIPVGRER